MMKKKLVAAKRQLQEKGERLRMGECKLDHSTEDVQKKLAEQAPFLPGGLADRLGALLETNLAQDRLNELFHLLKKYDLATEDERAQRDAKLLKLLG